MNPDPKQPEPQPGSPTPRQYTIDEDGNVRGVVLTVEVDHFVEFKDKAVDLTSGKPPSNPEKPTA